ncbi:hypothetical protein OIV83_003688 [Microbotryomycetes sp. JL201]|nr:hypothetical protein OIV83_003688 [Microbotryomycetes sp. JL201]
MSTPGKLGSDEVYLGSYLLERLVQLDVLKMFGVPGDFNLAFLDLVEDHDRMEWVGCCNELNAAYAADGFARVKQSQANYIGSKEGRKSQGGVKGLGALLTTFGVGEMSAMNGVAGAYSERVPIIHIVGVPSTKAQESKFLLHHTLGDGRFNVFEEASRGITKAQAFLQSVENACEEIDRVLRVALQTARPTYLSLPTDLVFAPVKKARLDTPVIPSTPSINEKKTLPAGIKVGNDAVEELNFVTSEISRLWEKAERPVVLVDACAIRYGVTHLVRDFVEHTKVPYFSTPMGKGTLDEDAKRGFGGVFVGEVSDPEVKKAVESTDLMISVGTLASDFNSGEFSWDIKKENLIELHSDHTLVQYAHYPSVPFHTLLPALTKTLKPKTSNFAPCDAGLIRDIPASPRDQMVTHEAFWPLMGKFFKDDDVILAETGTSSFGMINTALPNNATFLSQVLWGSIGWTGGALLGALMAAKEADYDRRVILFIGDGSLQLTVQEIATMLRHDLKPIIVVLNNDGYVIERLIHGKTRVYNDISSWDWQALLDLFNAKHTVTTKSYKAKTRGELETILNDKDFQKADKAQLLEVMMDRLDAPKALQVQAELSAKLNSS